MDNATLILRIEEIKGLVAGRDELEQLSQIIHRLEHRQLVDGQNHSQRLHGVEEQLKQQQSSCSMVVSTQKATASAVDEIKLMLATIVQAVASLQISATDHKYFKGPSKGFVTFEDHFGHIDPLPLGWIHSWEVRFEVYMTQLKFKFANMVSLHQDFQTILELRLKNTKGYDLVLQGSYLLEDDCNGATLYESQPFNEAFRADMKVNMSITFVKPRLHKIRTCPGCNLPAKFDNNRRAKW